MVRNKTDNKDFEINMAFSNNVIDQISTAYGLHLKIKRIESRIRMLRWFLGR